MVGDIDEIRECRLAWSERDESAEIDGRCLPYRSPLVATSALVPPPRLLGRPAGLRDAPEALACGGLLDRSDAGRVEPIEVGLDDGWVDPGEQVSLEERQRGDSVDLAREAPFGVLDLPCNTLKVMD